MPSAKKTRYAVLGLLMWNPMSGYDIKKLVDVGLSHFWNENYGQIYPTLDQLVKEGLATKKSERKSGKRKRFVYSITDDGKRAFRDWLAGPTDAPIVRNELQLKFFLSASSPAKAISLIESYRVQQTQLLEEYRASEGVLRAALQDGVSVEQLDDILAVTARTTQQKKRQLRAFLLTLRHGVLVVEARLAWCEEVISSLID